MKKIIKSVKNDIVILFVENDELVYKFDNFTTNLNEKHVYEFRRLCLLDAILTNIFRIVHDEFHLRFHKFYQNFFMYCIRNLTKKLKAYLWHCSQCQINQTRRHKAYEFLQLIDNSNVSFHIIIIDFILTLTKNFQKFDASFFATCKFFKRMTFISRKAIWFAQKWVTILRNRLNIMNWDLSKIIINNRDSKFFNEFWSLLFRKLEIRLFYNTIYHSQIDDQSKKTNQSIEIALRYHLTFLKNSSEWLNVLSTIQKTFNNSVCFTSFISNETIYEFTSNQGMNLSKLTQSFTNEHASMIVDRTRQEITDVIAFSQINVKMHYDFKHQSIQIDVENWALLRLRHEYNISSTKVLEKKFSQQFVKFFKILKKINRLTYKLKISKKWRIHLIFIINQLKSCFDLATDFFDRSRSKESQFVHVKSDTNKVKSFVLKKIVSTKKTARNKEYLIRWKRYDSKHDAWRSLSKMRNALNFVREYEILKR